MKNKTNLKNHKLTRRDFVKCSAVSLAAFSTAASRLHAAGTDTIKVGLIGCGGRGTGAATQVLLSTNTPVKFWAMGDLFGDQLDKCYKMLSEGAEARYDRDNFKSLRARMDAPESRRFVGFDAFKGVIDSGVDLVLLATPPHFRPEHFMAAVTAGKHVFMEKPAAVDPTGIRTLLAASEIAKQKGLSVAVGTKGQMYTDQAVGHIKDLKGNITYKYDGPNENPYYQEHRNLISSIREGKGLNEARNIAESTMTCIMGRMSAYTGRALKWDWVMKASKLDLSPPKYEFGDLPMRPVAMPGQTQLI